jgi:hypothetical protein
MMPAKAEDAAKTPRNSSLFRQVLTAALPLLCPCRCGMSLLTTMTTMALMGTWM